MERLSPEAMAIMRGGFFDKKTHNLVWHLGLYQLWFGIVELHITYLLLQALGYQDFEKFDLLVRGMDARVKVERLRRAAKAYKPMGPTLKKLLVHFETQHIPLRNRIAHSWPMLDDSDLIHFGTMGAMPSDQFKSNISVRPSALKPPSIHIDDFLHEALWLNTFASDLVAALNQSLDGGELEVASPTSDLPTAPPQGNRQPDGRAKSDKPPQAPPEKQDC
jgi:hypothetical protein